MLGPNRKKIHEDSILTELQGSWDNSLMDHSMPRQLPFPLDNKVLQVPWFSSLPLIPLC